MPVREQQENQQTFSQKVFGFVNDSLFNMKPALTVSSGKFKAVQAKDELGVDELFLALDDILHDSTRLSTSPCDSMPLSSAPETPRSMSTDSLAEDIDHLPIITLQEVEDHYSPNDAWMVIYDKVYNFTTFLEEHPGGFDILLDYVGYDGTLAFRGTGHSKAALKMMESYLIGILPESQRLYTNKMKW